MSGFVELKDVHKIYQMGEVEIRAVDGIDFSKKDCIEIKEYTDKINELKKEKNKILIDELKNSLSIKENSYYKIHLGCTIYYFKSKDVDFDLKKIKISNCLEEQFTLMSCSYKYYSFMFLDFKENIKFEEISKENYLEVISEYEEKLKKLKEE